MDPDLIGLLIGLLLSFGAIATGIILGKRIERA